MKRLLSVAWVLVSVVLAGHVAGSLERGADECCPCDAAESLESHADADGSAADDAHDPCPPGCDDCVCCGTPTMIASSSPLFLAAVGAVSIAPRFDAPSDAPSGERSGVFRPPRA